MNFDILHGTTAPTVYIAECLPNEFQNASVLQYYLVNQATGRKGLSIFQQVVPLHTANTDITGPESFYWNNELVSWCCAGFRRYEISH